LLLLLLPVVACCCCCCVALRLLLLLRAASASNTPRLNDLNGLNASTMMLKASRRCNRPISGRRALLVSAAPPARFGDDRDWRSLTSPV